MKIHTDLISTVRRGIRNKNQIIEERYESKGSRTVLKGRWGTVMFSTDPNKWAIRQLSKIAPVVTKFGWQTSNLRKHLGLPKQKQNKKEAIPATHAVDGLVLAATQFINYLPFHNSKSRGHCWQGRVGITNAPFFIIRRPRFSRRQLHLMLPSKGGNRRKYGGTITRHQGIRKGDFVEGVKAGIKYQGWCSGDTAKQVSISDANWKRISQFAASKVRLLQRSTGLICKRGNNFSVASIELVFPLGFSEVGVFSNTIFDELDLNKVFRA